MKKKFMDVVVKVERKNLKTTTTVTATSNQPQLYMFL